MRGSFAALAVLIIGCGDSGSGGNSAAAGGSGGSAAGAATGGQGTGAGGTVAMDAGSDAAPDSGVGAGGTSTYPAGPYGNQVGNVLPNIEMLGYVRHDTTGLANAAPLQPVTLADLRAAAPKPVAVIHISGFT